MDLAPVGLAILDRSLRYVFCNKALAEMNGFAAEDHIGKTIYDIVPTVAAVAEEPFRSVFKTGQPLNHLKIVGDTAQFAATPRTWLENVEPLPDEDGHIGHIIVSVFEVTDVEEMATALQQTESVLHVSQQLNPDGFAVIRAVRNRYGDIEDFVWDYANPACQRFVGGKPLVGQTMFGLVPEARELALRPMTEALESGQTTGMEVTVPRRGVPTSHQVRFVPIDQERLAVSYRDVSQEKRADDERNLLLAEYRHRIKNMLAVVLALTSQLSRAYPQSADMTNALARHLQAMAVAQDYVGLHPAAAVDLDELVRLVLAAFDTPALRFEGGPETSIAPEAAVPLALFLNEIATNAIKYGALGQDAGQATLRWERSGPRVQLEWQETRCGAGKPVGSQGFGHKLLRIVQSMLPEGKLEVEHPADGYCARLSFTCEP